MGVESKDGEESEFVDVEGEEGSEATSRNISRDIEDESNVLVEGF